jgi:hypothetical protein
MIGVSCLGGISTVKCKFFVGQKVVCIENWGISPDTHKPEMGKKYTIRSVIPDASELCYQYKKVPAVYLMEIKRNKLFPWEKEPPFYYWRFSPLTEEDIDISVFTNLLKPISVKEDA